jgi:hypothetical protein
MPSLGYKRKVCKVPIAVQICKLRADVEQQFLRKVIDGRGFAS